MSLSARRRCVVKPTLRIVALSCVFAILVFPGFGLAEKGGKGKPPKEEPPPPPANPAITYADSGALMVMNADGTNKQVVLPAEAGVGNFHPSWSPDGTELVFSSNIQGPGIYVINLDGSGLHKVIDTISPGVDIITPAWSPEPLADGEYYIAFNQFPGIPGRYMDLFAVRLDGSNLVNLTASFHPDWGEAGPTWRPDGLGSNPQLAAEVWYGSVESRPPNEPYAYQEIYVYDLTFDSQGNLSIHPNGYTNITYGWRFSVAHPDWANTYANRSKIAVEAYDPYGDGAPDVWLLDVTGAPPIQLTDTPTWRAQEKWPTWSPDDSQLVFCRNNDKRRSSLYVVNADGTGYQEVGSPTREEGFWMSHWRRCRRPEDGYPAVVPLCAF
jgi:hypothetical protein